MKCDSPNRRETAIHRADERVQTESMGTALITHAACLGHLPPPGHPETSARLRAVLDGLEGLPLIQMVAPKASREQLLRVHTSGMVDEILSERAQEARRNGYAQIDADTFMSANSAEAALYAAGAVVKAVDGVVSAEFSNAFCAVRPPGHHAESGRSMGFCLFNNIAVGALHARDTLGLQRMAVVDFDVHHGNGTQDAFFSDPDVFYASTHQMPLYPGTGFADERGVDNNVLNLPLRPGSGSADFHLAYKDIMLPALEAFHPDLIFISAGFDAHSADPLASLNLTADDFGWVTKEICAIASRVCGGRVVSALEGGYDLNALAASARAHVSALLEA
jgi:acetoin utilization deacetylase AcuC-like enzyme